MGASKNMSIKKSIHAFGSWFCLLVAYVLLLLTTPSRAQSASCTTAQNLQLGTVDAAALTAEIDTFLDTSALTNRPASDFPPEGQWFTYKTLQTESIVTKFFFETTSTESCASIFIPDFAIFKGSCSSLLFELEERELAVLEVEAGIDYFIFVYIEGDPADSLDLRAPYTITVEEWEPPANDKIENAIALTTEDLPFKGDYTFTGARSDFSEDGCALDGEAAGVWFSYTTSFAEEAIVLQLSGFPDNFIPRTTVGIQVATGDQPICVAIGDPYDPIEWVAVGGIRYDVLVTWIFPEDIFSFEFKLQSRGGILTTPSPTGSITDSPVGSPSEASGGTSGTPTASPVEGAVPTIQSPSIPPSIIDAGAISPVEGAVPTTESSTSTPSSIDAGAIFLSSGWFFSGLVLLLVNAI